MNPGVQILHDRRVSVAFCPQTLAAQAVDKRTARALDPLPSLPSPSK